jgi:hypothetical protein
MTTRKGDVFISNATMGSRAATATLLVGTADEHGIPQENIHTVPGGFFVTDDLADILYDGPVDANGDGQNDVIYDPSGDNIDAVKVHVGEHPEQAEAILAAEQGGKNRPSLITWLTEFINQQASGDPAAKNENTEE